jgi:hypothetical protein
MRKLRVKNLMANGEFDLQMLTRQAQTQWASRNQREFYKLQQVIKTKRNSCTITTNVKPL